MNVQRLFRQYAEEHAIEGRVDLRFGECAIQILTNSTDLIKRMQSYFKLFTESSENPDIIVHAFDDNLQDLEIEYTPRLPEPGKTRLKEEYLDLEDGRIVRKIKTGMVMFFGDGKNVIVGPCLKFDNQVVNFIINRYMEWMIRRGCILFHAAGVSLQNAGISLCGFSGMGKSTLALHLMNRGTTFVSNDRVLARKNNSTTEMLGVPKLPRINPGTIIHNEVLKSMLDADERERLRKLPGEELWELEDKYDVSISRFYGSDRFRLSAHMGALVILNWNAEGEDTRVRNVDVADRPDLFPAFVKTPGLFYDPLIPGDKPDFSNAAYIEFLQGLDVYEISGGIDFDWAAECCLDMME